jgi:hypothetical protein
MSLQQFLCYFPLVVEVSLLAVPFVCLFTLFYSFLNLFLGVYTCVCACAHTHTHTHLFYFFYWNLLTAYVHGSGIFIFHIESAFEGKTMKMLVNVVLSLNRLHTHVIKFHVSGKKNVCVCARARAHAHAVVLCNAITTVAKVHERLVYNF